MPGMYRAPAGTPLPPGHSHDDPCPGGRHWQRAKGQPPTPLSEISLAEWVASHECGHALLARETGMRTRWMRIRRGWFGRFDGYTEIACDDVCNAERRDLIWVSVAGMQATSMWLQRAHNWPAGRANASARGSKWCDDRRMFAAFSQGTNYTLARACAEVDPILRRHWPRIERATGLLAERHKLRATAI